MKIFESQKNYLATLLISYWLSDSLDLIQSPRKLLEAKSLERSAACLTTIYIVNTLFTPKSNAIDFKWMEITHTSTDNTKWGCLGLPVHNSSVTSLVDMELSMDILMEYHERYIKKNLMTIKLPKTEIAITVLINVYAIKLTR
ncbi:hypothetical protein CLU79DRAFT_850447 [Phycomyces nitens]|nr:hypothetical protein CLU79DRAFT_850447 [Phycomyces nitens]